MVTIKTNKIVFQQQKTKYKELRKQLNYYAKFNNQAKKLLKLTKLISIDYLIPEIDDLLNKLKGEKNV